jgi:hypothetical protein
VLHFFCNHRNPRKQAFQDCLHAFTKQLIDSNSDCFNEAKQCYHERLLKIHGQQHTPTLSIYEYISLIKQLCFIFDTVFMVVDALDECADRSDFLDGLMSFLKEKGKFKLLLTSRQEVDLDRLIDPIASHRLPLKDYMGSDIKSYLSAELRTRIEEGALKLGRESLIADIAAAIEKKADGM